MCERVLYFVGPRPVSGAFTLDLEKIEAVAKDLVPDSGPEVPVPLQFQSWLGSLTLLPIVH